MDQYRQELIELLKPLLDDYGLELKESSKAQIEEFEKSAHQKNVPQKAILELKKFYSIINGIDPSLDSLWICKSEDLTIYEFWQDQNLLWIGQRDMDLLSWKEAHFHLGSASELNYGKGYVFDNLLELLKKGFKDWYPASNGQYPN